MKIEACELSGNPAYKINEPRLSVDGNTYSLRESSEWVIDYSVTWKFRLGYSGSGEYDN